MSSLLQNPGFGKLIPGFDFLQTLAKGAAQNIPQLPNLGNWVAPTLNVEELEKRIDELKAVQFWLDQNATALKATIQALEVQKMTLATLHGMNFNMGDVANAFKLKAADAVMSGVQKAAEKVAAADAAADNMATKPPSKVRGKTTGGANAKAAPGVVDPLQWWGALTQQFQQIAAGAMKEAAKQATLDTTRNVAAGLAKGALQTATGMAGSATRVATKSVASGLNRARAGAQKTVKKRTSRGA
ncbi:MAG TPA: PhaM family polyhydroxyalkanoate granule multifunctional regulatory protein [Rhodoferax sp.]|nr:PhaM family polyhydroxyalkanoate granule multifunctional regulatory protein [Rhodoferax sp.]